MYETKWAKAHWAKTTTSLLAINNMYSRFTIGNLNIKYYNNRIQDMINSDNMNSTESTIQNIFKIKY